MLAESAIVRDANPKHESNFSVHSTCETRHGHEVETDSAAREAAIASRIAASRAAAVARRAAKEEVRVTSCRTAAGCGFDDAEVTYQTDEAEYGHDHMGLERGASC